MRGYELTERGKIIIAVLLVLILLVIPSTIIAFKTVAARMTDSIPPSGDTVETPKSEPASSGQNGSQLAAETPPVTGSASGQSGTEQASEPNTPAEPAVPQTESSLDGKTLSFIFSPKRQTQLDSETDALIDAFLEIPEYLEDCVIVTETRQISDAAAGTLMDAVEDALKRRGVTEEQIEYLSFPPVVEDEEKISVSMYFVTKWTK